MAWPFGPFRCCGVGWALPGVGYSVEGRVGLGWRALGAARYIGVGVGVARSAWVGGWECWVMLDRWCSGGYVGWGGL